MQSIPQLPFLGFGLGLRKEHYHDLLNKPAGVDWLEIITENFLVPGGKPLYYLDSFAELYPLVMHGVSLSIGSCDPLNMDYLKQVKKLCARIQAPWISDHLCWTGIDHTNLHDLMPLPYTEEAVKHVAFRIKQVQEFLERPLLLENVSSYIQYKDSTMSEAQFYTAVVEESNCLMLLDINNVYVSSINHGFHPGDYIESLPRQRVKQIHLAGHVNLGTHIIDTHDSPVIKPVWSLYQQAIQRFAKVSTMIERDANIPPLDTLLSELEHAKALSQDAMRQHHEFT